MKFSYLFTIISMVILTACNSIGNSTAIAPTANAVMHSGAWLGTFSDGQNRSMDMTMDMILDGKHFSGEIQIRDEDTLDIQSITGTVQGTKIQFKDGVNRFYWGTLDAHGIQGYVGWECYECSYWGTFYLGYMDPHGHIDLTPFVTLKP